jgi:hypothetical protein
VEWKILNWCKYWHSKIIWLSGPWKGAASDPTIAKVSGIKQSLPPGEAVLANNIYQGD